MGWQVTRTKNAAPSILKDFAGYRSIIILSCCNPYPQRSKPTWIIVPNSSPSTRRSKYWGRSFGASYWKMKPSQLGLDERNSISGNASSCPRSSANGSRFNPARLPQIRRMKHLKSQVCQATSTGFAVWIRYVIGWHLCSSSTFPYVVCRAAAHFRT